jgi:hypothetical protein
MGKAVTKIIETRPYDIVYERVITKVLFCLFQFELVHYSL